MTKRARLLRVHTELTEALFASQTWEKSYKADPATLKRMVREAAELNTSVIDYLAGLSDRAIDLVNWNDPSLDVLLMAAAVPPMSDDIWKREQQLLHRAVGQHIINLMTIGGNAGERIYNRPIGINPLSEFILDAAEKHTAALVKDVTETTRTYIQSVITQSIAEGRDSNFTLDLIKERITNPVRAELITQTEPVNAYQVGLKNFADETGAISKTWDSLAGACDTCGPIDGQTVDVSDEFELDTGDTVDIPAAHPRCRCGVIYNYPK